MASIHEVKTGYQVRCSSPRFKRLSLGTYKDRDIAYVIKRTAEHLLSGSEYERRKVSKESVKEEIDKVRAYYGLRMIFRNK